MVRSHTISFKIDSSFKKQNVCGSGILTRLLKGAMQCKSELLGYGCELTLHKNPGGSEERKN